MLDFGGVFERNKKEPLRPSSTTQVRTQKKIIGPSNCKNSTRQGVFWIRPLRVELMAISKSSCPNLAGWIDLK